MRRGRGPRGRPGIPPGPRTSVTRLERGGRGEVVAPGEEWATLAGAPLSPAARNARALPPWRRACRPSSPSSTACRQEREREGEEGRRARARMPLSSPLLRPPPLPLRAPPPPWATWRGATNRCRPCGTCCRPLWSLGARYEKGGGGGACRPATASRGAGNAGVASGRFGARQGARAPRARVRARTVSGRERAPRALRTRDRRARRLVGERAAPSAGGGGARGADAARAPAAARPLGAPAPGAGGRSPMRAPRLGGASGQPTPPNPPPPPPPPSRPASRPSWRPSSAATSCRAARASSPGAR